MQNVRLKNVLTFPRLDLIWLVFPDAMLLLVFLLFYFLIFRMLYNTEIIQEHENTQHC